MLIKNSKALRQLSSSWFASNSFDNIALDIEMETEELAKIVGDDIIDLAQGIAEKESPTEDESKLLQRVQLPIALMSVYRYYQSNTVSHDDTRKLKVNAENEKIPFQWMLDRDDAAHLAKAQRAVDRLISFLDKSDLEQWHASSQKLATKKLFVNNTEVFGDYYPIDNSARFYYLAAPLLREVQTNAIKDALGPDYDNLLANFQANKLTNIQKELLDIVRRAQVLATLSVAVRRLNTQVLPDGIVKAMKSEGHTQNANRPATIEEINYFSKRLDQDAEHYIDKIKRKRYEDDPEKLQYQFLPKNDPKQKFAST